MKTSVDLALPAHRGYIDKDMYTMLCYRQPRVMLVGVCSGMGVQSDGERGLQSDGGGLQSDGGRGVQSDGGRGLQSDGGRGGYSWSGY